MIVRILGEGQFRVPGETADALHEIDAALDFDLHQEHPAEFSAHLAEMQRIVRASGLHLADAELLPSDVLLPAEGSTLEEVRQLLTADGLIPG